jgi:hypothetical protein
MCRHTRFIFWISAAPPFPNPYSLFPAFLRFSPREASCKGLAERAKHPLGGPCQPVAGFGDCFGEGRN